MAKKRKVSSNKNVKKTSGKRRKRRSYRRLKKMIIGLVIFLIVIITLIAKRNSIILWKKGYTSEERKILLTVEKDELKEYLKLDDALDLTDWNEYANHKHYYDYVLYQNKFPDKSTEEIIKYIDSFYDLYPSLVDLGYSKEFLRDKMKTFSIDDFSLIVKKSYTYETVIQYLNVNGCQISDLRAYIDSGLEPLNAVLSITYPFINSSVDTDITYSISNPKKIDTLVKTGFTLSSDYEPNDLVQVNLPLQEIDSAFLRKEAATALTKMADDAKAENLYIGVRSAYRSYAEQEEVYNYYINLYGYYYAIQLVSVPGSSEHQLGLGVDLTSQSVIDGTYGTFDQTEEYSWVINNCYKYGFVLRYPENKTDLTGAMNEPWHFRYVGVDAATEIYNNGWTLEEYILNHGFSSELIRN